MHDTLQQPFIDDIKGYQVIPMGERYLNEYVYFANVTKNMTWLLIVLTLHYCLPYTSLDIHTYHAILYKIFDSIYNTVCLVT